MSPPGDIVRAVLEQAWQADCPSDVYLARRVVSLNTEIDTYMNTVDTLADVIRDIQRALDEAEGDGGLVDSVLNDYGISITYG